MRHALAGLRQFFIAERSGWVLVCAGILVLIAGVCLQLSADEWRWVVAAIGLILVAETFNSAVERLGDAITIEANPHVKFAKDVAAGAVLVAVISSIIIAATIFAPHLVRLFT